MSNLLVYGKKNHTAWPIGLQAFRRLIWEIVGPGGATLIRFPSIIYGMHVFYSLSLRPSQQAISLGSTPNKNKKRKIYYTHCPKH